MNYSPPQSRYHGFKKRKGFTDSYPVQALQMMINRPERQDCVLRRQRAASASRSCPECDARAFAQINDWAHAYSTALALADMSSIWTLGD